jgi:hypothetical protein
MVKCTGYLPVNYTQSLNAHTEGRCEYCAPARLAKQFAEGSQYPRTII